MSRRLLHEGRRSTLVARRTTWMGVESGVPRFADGQGANTRQPAPSRHCRSDIEGFGGGSRGVLRWKDREGQWSAEVLASAQDRV